MLFSLNKFVQKFEISNKTRKTHTPLVTETVGPTVPHSKKRYCDRFQRSATKIEHCTVGDKQTNTQVQ